MPCGLQDGQLCVFADPFNHDCIDCPYFTALDESEVI